MRCWVLAATVCAALLSGCGGSDAGQRKAFVTFLQSRVVDRPGMHMAQPTAEERASFGHYADHYAIITDFNHKMDESISPKLSAGMNAASIQSLEDVVTGRAKLQGAKTSIDAMADALKGDLAQADAAHARLDQPADVKAVYDKAYDRLVTAPAAAFKGIVPVMDTVLGEAIDLGRYVDEHRSAIRLSGSTIETSDPAVRSAINDKLQALQSSQQAVQSAQARLQSVVYGNAS